MREMEVYVAAAFRGGWKPFEDAVQIGTDGSAVIAHSDLSKGTGPRQSDVDSASLRCLVPFTIAIASVKTGVPLFGMT